ncbi:MULTISPECIES: hypothetical protein [unclassified Dysgonomonas]|uniref:hypothetical protein n=1 Tax=unclassified Dysgonomonas TaxID=2630389 RepID=UPI0025C44884|nr:MULTISPECIES: hypothetical protein [unclassified Dysgonomonas]HMM02023.1 hypothetical protein [Dysgonomonas sp.]
MISLNREKRGHFNRLRAASHVEADLALLKSIDPNHSLIVKPSGKDQKYADDVLYALLSLTNDCDIVSFRRQFAKAKLQKAHTETLKKRFADYIAKVEVEKAIDIKLLIDKISEGLLLVVTPVLPVGEEIFPAEIEIFSIDNEKFDIRLTAEAVIAREAAAKLKKEQGEAERKRLEAESAANVLAEKESELDEKEEELLNKESDLEDKEIELSKKEDRLDEKEAELAVKETDLKNKSAIEKKSVSKKKSTRK